MKRSIPITFVLLTWLFNPLFGQKQDTAAYGNLVITSEPKEVQVEIPSLKINYAKKDETMLIEFIPPANYLIRVTAKKQTLEYHINVKPNMESQLFFHLKKKQATLKDEYALVRRNKKEVIEDANLIYTVVEEQPHFPGGHEAVYAFLKKNLHYPDSALKNRIQGKVFIGFVVEKDGSLSNVKVLRGIGGGCDEEAVRVFKMMPNWIPGRQRGQAMRVQCNYPVGFFIDKD